MCGIVVLGVVSGCRLLPLAAGDCRKIGSEKQCSKRSVAGELPIFGNLAAMERQ